jgi:hypothetical protein
MNNYHSTVQKSMIFGASKIYDFAASQSKIVNTTKIKIFAGFLEKRPSKICDFWARKIEDFTGLIKNSMFMRE